jgi:hypothetical protein
MSDAAPVYEPAGDHEATGPVICRYGLDRSTRSFATHAIFQELRQRSVIVQAVLLEGIETIYAYTPPWHAVHRDMPRTIASLDVCVIFFLRGSQLGELEGRARRERVAARALGRVWWVACPLITGLIASRTPQVRQYHASVHLRPADEVREGGLA